MVAEFCQRADIVIDGVFGAGTTRPIDQRLGGLFRAVSRVSQRIAAIDIPSGADSDTGHFDPNGLPADCTLSIGLPKLGTALRFGQPEFGIEHHVIDVGVPAQLTRHIRREVITDETASQWLPKRPATSHKGDHGRTLLIVGSEAYPGAAVLATLACARSSVGLLTVAATQSVSAAVAANAPEATHINLPVTSDGAIDVSGAMTVLSRAIQSVDSVLIGCGLGISDPNRTLLEGLFSNRDIWVDTVAVVDADALTMMSGTSLWDALDGKLIATPHPGEMARLLDSNVVEVESDRLAAVQRATDMLDGVVVLKGASTLIADRSHRLRINMRPNSGLARGGTGDVLAGLTAGLAAQLSPFDAASLAVYLHGVAGEIAAAEVGVHGMTASDVIERIQTAFRRLASFDVGT